MVSLKLRVSFFLPLFFSQHESLVDTPAKSFSEEFATFAKRTAKEGKIFSEYAFPITISETTGRDYWYHISKCSLKCNSIVFIDWVVTFAILNSEVFYLTLILVVNILYRQWIISVWLPKKCYIVAVGI